ncbi:MAG: hypothetical protein IPK29_07865 [Betaproteobacteria bacterium]|nr:hypothetical protein [Betaproteobacteria bacterium]
MNKSLLIAASLAVVLAACGKEEPKPAPAPAPAPQRPPLGAGPRTRLGPSTKPRRPTLQPMAYAQAEAPKADAPKADAPADTDKANAIRRRGNGAVEGAKTGGTEGAAAGAAKGATEAAKK